MLLTKREYAELLLHLYTNENRWTLSEDIPGLWLRTSDVPGDVSYGLTFQEEPDGWSFNVSGDEGALEHFAQLLSSWTSIEERFRLEELFRKRGCPDPENLSKEVMAENFSEGSEKREVGLFRISGGGYALLHLAHGNMVVDLSVPSIGKQMSFGCILRGIIRPLEGSPLSSAARIAGWDSSGPQTTLTPQ